ncbi:MAG: hypothetical protein [Circular genetic element sp.]|nr:MAG: hypothetical protein [Circular genetic element sp.]
MATAKTGSFYLTETVTIAAASAASSRTQGVVDLGAYVNVPTGQALAIESVDFIYQQTSEYAGGPVQSMLAANGALTVQLTDLNPGSGFVRADDQSLIASAAMNIDTNANIATHTSDLYPDNFGPTNMSEAFMVVNDSLYLVAGNDDAAVGGNALYITARIRCRVVKLSQQDWMAIAIQSTASDN